MAVFHHVMELGSATAAADAAHLSQPAASKLLQQAEARLGFRLFLRQRKRLIPTAEAQSLFPEVVSALAAIDAVQRLGRDLGDGRSGLLTLAVTPTLAHSIVPRAIRRFRDQRPEVSVAPHQPVHMLLQRAFEAAGLPLRIAVEASQSSIACALAQAGAGIAVLDGFAPMGAHAQGIETRPFRPAVTMQARLLQSRRRPLSNLAQDYAQLTLELAKM